MRQTAFTARPVGEFGVGKSGVDSIDGSLLPPLGHIFRYSVAQHSLDEPMNGQRTALRIAFNQRMSQQCFDSLIKQIGISSHRNECVPKLVSAFNKDFFRDRIRSKKSAE